jgi:diguanylate cyclase (GGDEF)-like protein
MDQERLEASLEGIRHLLSHLHGEVTALEDSYAQVLLVLRKFEGVCDVDDLSGLLRRRAFFHRWETLLQECQRLNESCGVLLIDIDHFKRVNDTHGHPTGDEVIKRVASLLKQYESPNCVVGRYGGEEFALAVRGSDAEVLGLAEFIRRGAERLHGPVIGPDGAPQSGVEWKCTLSVGMASARKEGYDASRLLKVADVALYEAKRKGRNRVHAA